jgi:hypothetical protein
VLSLAKFTSDQTAFFAAAMAAHSSSPDDTRLTAAVVSHRVAGFGRILMAAEKVCLVSTVKSSLRQTTYFVNYHLNIGFDEIILFFDNPNDPAIEAFSDYARVRSIRCDDRFWAARGTPAPIVLGERQEINVNYGMKLAVQSGFDWLVHIDADELLMTERSIKAALSQRLADVVRFQMKEAVSERDHYEHVFEATLFREPITAERQYVQGLAHSSQFEGAFFDGEYFRGHSHSKVAVRTNSEIEWMGIHRPKRPKMAVAETKEITLLHYDCVGLDDWKEKWTTRLGQPGSVERLRPNRVRQVELFKQACGNPAAESRLYSRLHMTPDRQKDILKQHGLLTVIKLHPELFERP